MRVLVVQNYEGAGLGQIGPVLDEAGAQVDHRYAFRGDALPEKHEDHDALIVLGGEQNALADAEFPYFPGLLDLIRQFGDADKAVLGICLGSQLVARAHGGENIIGRPLEFGWHNVSATAHGSEDPVLGAAPENFPIFHWHSDTFSLPEGAVHLASSAMTPNQAYRIGRATYGTQFHFEADRTLVEEWKALLADQIAVHTPDWLEQYPVTAASVGAEADLAGAALARAWVGLIRPA